MEKKKVGLVLRVRAPAFGLPTACLRCLPTYLHLQLAGLDFSSEYVTNMPDSDDLPIVEFGFRSGFASECGGIEEFLKTEKIGLSLDAGFSEAEIAEVDACKALISRLSDALLFELWSRENEAVAGQVYLAALPWPINKVLDWDMRRKVMNRLGITKENADDREAEILKNASDAYESLSAKRQNTVFFLQDRPTSVDALLLAHIMLVNALPLEKSHLKDRLNKHHQLIAYRETAGNNLPTATTSVQLPPVSPSSPTRGPSSPRGASTSFNKGENKKVPTSKERAFRKKAKYFVFAQIAAIVGFVIMSGMQYDESDVDDDSRDDE